VGAFVEEAMRLAGIITPEDHALAKPHETDWFVPGYLFR
jgi:hypothetical protein